MGGNPPSLALFKYSSQHLLLNLSSIIVSKVAKKIGEKFTEYQEQIDMAKQLATIVTDLKLIKGVNDIQWQEPRWRALKTFCNDMGFPRLYRRIEQLRDIR